MAAEQAKTNSEAQGQQSIPELAIQRLYTKDISFESPLAPAIFREEWHPEVSIDIDTMHSVLEADLYEVVLTVTVTAKVEGDKVAFLAEVKQAGVFSARNLNQEQLHHVMHSYCPAMLFPYAREAISSLVGRGSFPQLVLTPVNFDALYEQHLRQQAEEQEKSGSNASDTVSH